MSKGTPTVGRITRGAYKGAIVKPCTGSMDCPFFSGANDERVTVAYVAEDTDQHRRAVGQVIALKDSEVRWL